MDADKRLQAAEALLRELLKQSRELWGDLDAIRGPLGEHPEVFQRVDAFLNPVVVEENAEL